MMLRTRLALLALTLPSLLFCQTAIDGFMKEKGRIDVALSMNMETGNGYLLAGGETQDITFPSSTLGAFVSYGISKRVNAIASLPVVNGEIQDLALFVKADLLSENAKIGTGRLRANIGAGFSTPLSGYSTGIQKAIGQQADQLIVVGNVQHHFHKNWFLNLSGRFNAAQDPVNNAIGMSGKVGYINGKWYADAWLEQQVMDGEDFQNPGFVDIDFLDMRPIGMDFLRVGGTVYHQTFDRLGFFVGWGQVLDGENVWDITRFTFGLNAIPLKK